MTDYSSEQRRKMAAKGQAMAGGKYPIKNCQDVRNAVRLAGHGKGSASAIKAHIKKRARALGCTDSIPDDWQ
jgi:hypothetical protein